MKHYFNPMSRGATTDWMLKELAVPCEQIIVDIEAGENKAPAYRHINPMQKVPALVDGETVVTETAAICAYLADKFPGKGLAPKPGTFERGVYYRYLFIAGNTLEPAITLAALGLEHSEPGSAGWGDMSRIMATINELVPETDWALGRQFSAADVVFGALLDSSVTFGLIEASGKVAAYVERLRSRPAYQASHVALMDSVSR
ncbi:MAG: glutathione S-transferase family protein [Pseudomonadales bacterium]|nr:glutathione S-transferase family protein [Pseudomonadales bacterium]